MKNTKGTYMLMNASLNLLNEISLAKKEEQYSPPLIRKLLKTISTDDSRA